jgi:hypothetical protein
LSVVISQASDYAVSKVKKVADSSHESKHSAYMKVAHIRRKAIASTTLPAHVAHIVYP